MPPDPSPPPSPAAPRPDLDALTLALGSRVRWRLLAELSHGEPRELRELTQVTGTSKENTFRHLAVLRQAGLVVRGRGKLYQIPKERLPEPGKPLVEAGHCLQRLDQAR